LSERLRRAFVPLTPDPGRCVELDADESHHVARVLRLRAGDTLAVFDGRDGEWSARVEAIGRDRVAIVVGEPRPGDPEPPLEITLCQAIVRPERLEWVLQKGTEIGVSGFRLVPSLRGESAEPSPSRIERYRKIILEAVKQSGRRRIPHLELMEPSFLPSGVTAFLLDTAGDAPPIAGLLRRSTESPVWIAVGPEGGFDPSEITSRAQQGWQRVSLGPRILRTETAGVVAAAIVLHAWGDLGS
jgi:16S rRNA (uracil1498-N3)-methyltransferase